MKSRFTPLLALAFVVAAAPPAAAVLVLEATFDDDEVGAVPDHTLPGGPAGDALDLRYSGGSMTVETGYGSMTDQPLVCHRYTTGSFWANFVLPEEARECGSYTVSYRVELPAIVFFLACILRPEFGGGNLGSVEYRAGGAMSFYTSGNPLSEGYSAGVSQLIEVTYDRLAGTSSLSIDGKAVPEAQDIAVGTADFHRLQFSPGGTEDMRFVIDDVRIEAFDCDLVPTRTTSWGMVKALHR